MAIDKGDWFPVSFSLSISCVDVIVLVGTRVDVAVFLGVKVAGITVTIFVWITVTITAVCVGIGVEVAEGVFGGVNVREAVAEGVSKTKGTTYRRTNPIGTSMLINNKNTGKTFTDFIFDRPYESIP